MLPFTKVCFFFIVTAVLVYSVHGQLQSASTDCASFAGSDTMESVDSLASATALLEQFIREFPTTVGATVPPEIPGESLSLYNYTRIILGLDHSIRDQVQFTQAVREIALAQRLSVSDDPVQTTSSVREIFEQAESGANFDALQLRIHLGSLFAHHFGERTPAIVSKFFATLTLTQFGISVNLRDQFYTVAFAVDDTGSMADEIHHVTVLIREFVENGSASPSHYILTTFNDPDVGVPEKYNATSQVELTQLLTHVESLVANGGGDCPELTMTGLLDALNLSSTQGHIIVLTDAGPKDTNLTEDVIRAAQELQVTIHFVLSNPELCGDNGTFIFKGIAEATGGIVIEHLQGLTALSRHLNRFFRSDFIPVLDSSTSASKPNNNTDGLNETACREVIVSQFVETLSLGIAPAFGSERSISVDIFNPEDVIVHLAQISAFTIFSFTVRNSSEHGAWRVCSTDMEMTVTMTDVVDFDISIQFLEYNPDTGNITFTPFTPVNTSSAIVVVFSSQINNLSGEMTSFVEVMDPTGAATSQVPLRPCSSDESTSRSRTRRQSDIHSLQGYFDIPTFSFELAFTGFDMNGFAVKIANPVLYAPSNPDIVCKNPCQNGGICIVGNQCKCQRGWKGDQCTQFDCDCGSREVCVGPGVCMVPPFPYHAVLPPVAAVLVLVIIVIVVSTLGVYYYRKKLFKGKLKRATNLSLFSTRQNQLPNLSDESSGKPTKTTRAGNTSFQNAGFVAGNVTDIYY